MSVKTSYQLIGLLKNTDILLLTTRLQDAAWTIEEFETVDYIVIGNADMSLQIHPTTHPSLPNTFSFRIMGRFQQEPLLAYFIDKLFQQGFIYQLKRQTVSEAQVVDAVWYVHPDW